MKLEEEETARKAEEHEKQQQVLEINLKLLKQENEFMKDESRDLNSEDTENRTRKFLENLNLCESDRDSRTR